MLCYNKKNILYLYKYMYRKKLIILELVLVFAIGLAGCAKTQTTLPAPATPPPPAPAPFEKPTPGTSAKIEESPAFAGYLSYSESSFNGAASPKRVLFFHAPWCPTCKATNQDIMDNLSKIPAGVVIYKVDYDSEEALKTKYGITHQHTFVYVDKDGKEIKKWNGGGLAEILKNVQ